MSPGIFNIDDEGRLVEMTAQPYDSEALLQQLLEDYPRLLTGDQTGEPRRWLLIAREAALPAEEDAGARWSVDHLFVDQDGVPTLVEVKRSSDTRIRREVVGQMLDYAANAVRYWPVESMRAAFEETCAKRETSSEDALAELIGPDSDQDAFWQTVKTNLQAGRIRMLFVADEIPSELQTIVEFLNEQMSSAEVLAIEIKQYGGERGKTLVSRAIGQTATAQRAKGTGRQGRSWDEASFFSELEASCGADDTGVAREILDWAKGKSLRIAYGSGMIYGSFSLALDHKGEAHRLIGLYTNGLIELRFSWLQYRPPFDDESKRLELLRRVNELPGVSLGPDAITRMPSIPLGTLRTPDALASFLGTLDWFIEEVLAT